MKLEKFEDAVHHWMERVDAMEVSIEGRQVYVLMRKNRLDYKIFMEGWLNGDIPTPQFKQFLEDRYWWVQYPLRVFESEIYNG